MLFAAHPAAKNGVQPFGVHELDAAQVDYHLLGTRGASLGQGLVEYLRRCYVQFAAQPERVAVALHACVDAQPAHASPGYSGGLIADREELDRLLLAHQAPWAEMTSRPLVRDGQPAVEALQSEHLPLSSSIGGELPGDFSRQTAACDPSRTGWHVCANRLEAAAMRVLTWNLFHGRARPEVRRALLEEFAGHLSAWSWDVALLQEVPPWWPPQLAVATGTEQRMALTSRNAGRFLRRAVAERRPDVIRSNGGGCNAILSRISILEHSAVRLRIWPERRIAQLARLVDGTTVVNFHGSTDTRRAADELERLWRRARTSDLEAPIILGGDLNLRSLQAPCPGIRHVAQRDVDHLFTRGLQLSAEPEVLDRRVTLEGGAVEFSDHPPLLASLTTG
jgi:endonuclease/exonuclease/phosphatase family metal-dependent hydrolase